MASTAISIYKLRGLAGFYAGWTSLIMREIPFSAIQLTTYEIMKSFQRNYNHQRGYDDNLSFFQDSINGAVAGFNGALWTTPVDVIKTKMMVDRSQKPLTIGECLKSILQEEGVYGLFKAWKIRSFSIGAISIIFFSGYEYARKTIISNYYMD